MAKPPINWTGQMIRELTEMDDRRTFIEDIAKFLGISRDAVRTKLRHLGRIRGQYKPHGGNPPARKRSLFANRDPDPLPAFHPIARAVLAEAGLVF